MEIEKIKVKDLGFFIIWKVFKIDRISNKLKIPNFVYFFHIS